MEFAISQPKVVRRSGVRIYQIVTGMTSDVGVSTHLVSSHNHLMTSSYRWRPHNLLARPLLPECCNKIAENNLRAYLQLNPPGQYIHLAVTAVSKFRLVNEFTGSRNYLGHEKAE